MTTLFNNAKMNVSGTPGTADFTLSGAYSNGVTFAAAGVTDGMNIIYAAYNGLNFEQGQGVYHTAGPTLSRTVIAISSSNNGKVNFGAGTYVYAVAVADTPLTTPNYATIKTGLPFDTATNGQRITGNMSNTPVVNRLAFQTAILNGDTHVTALPAGNSNRSLFSAESDPLATNGWAAQLSIQGLLGEARFESVSRGTAGAGFLTFYAGGAERGRLTTTGMTLPGTLGVTGAATVGSLTSTGAAVLSSTAHIVGAATLDSSLAVTGAATLSSTAHIVGAATLDSSLQVAGATTLSTTLHLVGAGTFDASLGVAGAFTASSTAHIVGAATLDSSLAVTGGTTLSGTLHLVGAGTFDVALAVTGRLTATGGVSHGAGTATVAPITLAAGTNLTTPVQGAIEWNGSNLFYTDGSGRQTVASQAYVSSAIAGITPGNQTANFVLAGPTSGAAAAPTYRALVAADIPTLPLSKVTGAAASGTNNDITSLGSLSAVSIVASQYAIQQTLSTGTVGTEARPFVVYRSGSAFITTGITADRWTVKDSARGDGIYFDWAAGAAVVSGSLQASSIHSTSSILADTSITATGALAGASLNVGSGSITAGSGNISGALSAGSLTAQNAPKAWVRFAADGTIIRSFNVSGVSHDTTGQYTITFATAMPDTNYGWTMSCRRSPGASSTVIDVPEPSAGGITTTTLKIYTVSGVSSTDAESMVAIWY